MGIGVAVLFLVYIFMRVGPNILGYRVTDYA